MTRYIAQRLLFAIPSLLFVSFVIFSLVRMIPGDAVMARVAESGFVPAETLQQMRSELGIDKPFAVQYVTWVAHAARGDFGTSLWTREPVLPAIVHRMNVSLEISLLAVSVALLLAIPIGVISAVQQDRPLDYFARMFSVFGLSAPDFWLATVLLLILSKYFHWLPEFGWFSPLTDPVRNLQALIFPALIVGYRLSAISARMTRSAMLEVLREDYIRTARAKGLRDFDVIVRHALRNSLIPVITIVGTQLTALIGGLVIVEQIFSLPGQGRLLLDAVTHRDYPMVQGSVMVMALLFVASNLIIDLSYGLLDPRIRFR